MAVGFRFGRGENVTFNDVGFENFDIAIEADNGTTLNLTNVDAREVRTVVKGRGITLNTKNVHQTNTLPTTKITPLTYFIRASIYGYV